MLNAEQQRILKQLKEKPALFGHMVGFNKLNELNNQWIQSMVYGKEDETLQAHRLSYKTTCVSISLALITLLYPRLKTMFNRKTDTDTKEVMEQVKKILRDEHTQYLSYLLWGNYLAFVQESQDSFTTNLAVSDPRGTAQLFCMGTSGSVTGKHFDRIFTDDIINLKDRQSKAERERTKAFYQELQNVKNKGGRIYNTGTPWHEDDCFQIMPEPNKYDCYTTGIITEEEIESKRVTMAPTLFAVNYELRHIAADNLVFLNPNTNADPVFVEQGEGHIDAAYGGDDYTAFTIMRYFNGKYYVLGKLWHKHVDECLDEILAYMSQYNGGIISCEKNADKGYLAKELRNRHYRTRSYHENMNKALKIMTYLKAVWKDVYFVAGTDEEYIRQVTDWTEEADHDDAPDSLASSIRRKFGQRNKNTDPSMLVYL